MQAVSDPAYRRDGLSRITASRPEAARLASR